MKNIDIGELIDRLEGRLIANDGVLKDARTALKRGKPEIAAEILRTRVEEKELVLGMVVVEFDEKAGRNVEKPDLAYYPDCLKIQEAKREGEDGGDEEKPKKPKKPKAAEGGGQ